jgi:ATP-dependent DNA helicase RecG
MRRRQRPRGRSRARPAESDGRDHDGFEIARRDLEIRGPGEFLGARQSGAPLLRFADLVTDSALLEWARAVAPLMLDRHPALAAHHVARWLGGKSEYLKA